MIFVILIPLSVAFFNAGRTLPQDQSRFILGNGTFGDILRRIRRINNNRIFRLVVRYEVGVIIARPLPYSTRRSTSTISPFEESVELTHRNRLDMHLPCSYLTRLVKERISNDVEVPR